MYALAGIGLLLIASSLAILLSPERWARFWVEFSGKSYFHVVEIGSRIVLAVMLFAFAEQAIHPLGIRILGGVVACGVIGLLVMGEARHKRFAVVVFDKYLRLIRWMGLAGIVVGLWVVYASVGPLIMSIGALE